MLQIGVYLVCLRCSLIFSHICILVVMLCCILFFFQAEDGIRDLVRSRGLGDVYKRQGIADVICNKLRLKAAKPNLTQWREVVDRALNKKAVSYTHLTLPTSDLV